MSSKQPKYDNQDKAVFKSYETVLEQLELIHEAIPDPHIRCALQGIILNMNKVLLDYQIISEHRKKGA